MQTDSYAEYVFQLILDEDVDGLAELIQSDNDAVFTVVDSVSKCPNYFIEMIPPHNYVRLAYHCLEWQVCVAVKMQPLFFFVVGLSSMRRIKLDIYF
jgi:hypothetical protein